ncbi:MAG TPA: glutamyl-tRNA reductase [Anaeromyxobacteraceae bacterium]|nr:glutamyl-tRNA reductase [Anaeromyxobacteraceae bacterium]
MLVAVGVDQKRVCVAAREKLAASASELAGVVRAYGLIDGVDEVFVLSTCYRVEVYAATACPAAAAAGIGEALRARSGDPDLLVFDLRGEEAFRHLVRVAASLESGVVGEPQVLGQVKEAFGQALESGTAGKELRATMARALQAAKRVRAETSIGRAGVSWGHAAASVAEKVLGPLEGRRALVVGAGEMARLAAQHLSDQGAEITVVNRSEDRARALASEVGGSARPAARLGEELERADVVIVAAPVAHPALAPAGAAKLMRQRRHRRLLLVDLAVPRAIPADLGGLDGFYLCDVDDLARIQRQAQAERASAVDAAEHIVDEEVDRYARHHAERRAAPLIAAVRHQASAIAREEVERTVKRLGGNPELERRLDALAGAIVSKLLHQPSVCLREAGTAGDDGAELMSAAARIFDVGTVAGGLDRAG